MIFHSSNNPLFTPFFRRALEKERNSHPRSPRKKQGRSRSPLDEKGTKIRSRQHSSQPNSDLRKDRRDRSRRRRTSFSPEPTIDDRHRRRGKRSASPRLRSNRQSEDRRRSSSPEAEGHHRKGEGLYTLHSQVQKVHSQNLLKRNVSCTVKVR